MATAIDRPGNAPLATGVALCEAPSGAMLERVAVDYDSEYFAAPGKAGKVRELARAAAKIDRAKRQPRDRIGAKPARRGPSKPPGAVKPAGRFRAICRAAIKAEPRARYAVNCVLCEDGHTVCGHGRLLLAYRGELCEPGLHWVHKPARVGRYGYATDVAAWQVTEPTMAAPLPWRSILPSRCHCLAVPLADMYHWLALALCVEGDDRTTLWRNSRDSLGMTSGSMHEHGEAEVNLPAGPRERLGNVEGRRLRDALDWLARCGDTIVYLTIEDKRLRLDGESGLAVAVIALA